MLKNIKATLYALKVTTQILLRDGRSMLVIRAILSRKGSYEDINGVRRRGNMYNYIKHSYMNGLEFGIEDINRPTVGES